MNIEGCQPIVFDSGTGLFKGGYSGSTRPKVLIRNEVGRPRHQKLFGQSSRPSHFVGTQLEKLRGLLHINHPIQNSIVHDWNDMQEVWKYAYNELDANSKEHPILLTEPPLNPVVQRAHSAQIFFEHFFVPRLFFASQAVLNLYASGRTIGLVVGCGEGITFSVPIYEGFTLQHAIVQSSVAGRSVDEQLQCDLRKLGLASVSSASLSVLRNIKETKCFVSCLGNAHREFNDLFTLPDGRTVNIGSCAHTAPEVLFHPNRFGLEASGVQESIMESIKKVDLELRLGLFENVLLAGGTSMIPGFGERLIDEMKAMVSATTRICIYAPSDRLLSCWIGGSIISSMSSFQNSWLTKLEYHEVGESIFHRKGFI